MRKIDLVFLVSYLKIVGLSILCLVCLVILGLVIYEEISIDRLEKAAIVTRSQEGDCPNVYVDGKRVGVTLKDCQMREYTTFTRLPEGSSLEIKGEDYETAYFRLLAVVKTKREGRIKVGAGYKYKWQVEVKEWCVKKHTSRAYIQLKKGESLKFRERIEDGYYLMATGWYEPSR